MTLCFAVVHEAEADFQTATELADRMLVDAIDWLDEDSLKYQRAWLAHAPDATRLRWTALPKLALAAQVRATGHFQGEAGHADARAARRAIRYLLKTFADIDGVVLVRDQDDQPRRRDGLEQARTEHQGRMVIVVGLAIVERESWVISGFEPADETEEARLQALRTRLGFDPRARSHDLTACKDDNANRSPKRALRELSDDDHDRERRCWRECPLEVLRGRGHENGLAAYLGEVRDRLAPLIGHVPGS